MMKYVGYIPVPVWDGQRWQPRNFAGPSRGPEIIPWPDGVDSSTLPIPPVSLREHVRFHFGHQIMEGDVTEITMSGGAISEYQNEAEEIKRRYQSNNIRLTIYANGHGRWASIKDIIR